MIMKQYDMKVNYAIGMTSRYAIKKASMKAVFVDLYKFWQTTAKRNDFEAFITDTTGKMFLFTFERGTGSSNYLKPYGSYDFLLSQEFTSDETPTGDDVTTFYAVDYKDARKRDFDFEYAEYEVERY